MLALLLCFALVSVSVPTHYETLGFGDIYPTGALRVVCGIESLIGLLMVGWTASFTYLEMRRYW